tara:strand:- start:241 stop:681 length:441 start_codon:yes stop_codon:yes gene_type:complete
MLRVSLISIVVGFLLWPVVAEGGSSLPHSQVEIEQGHPCEYPGLDLAQLTSFFLYKWNARYKDLTDEAVRAWVEHHDVQDRGIILVRIFQSHMQKKMAVVSARKASPLNGQEFPTMRCVVKIDNQISKTYTSERLMEILSQPDKDI